VHAEALRFARRVLATLSVTGHVVEIGSRNVNGSVRPLLEGAASYTGIDVMPGPGVDVVADGTTFTPTKTPDLIVCMETLEHAEQAPGIVYNAAAILRKPGGRLVVTCATDPRSPHSGEDGGPLKDGEFYRNVPPADLVRWTQQAGLLILEQEVHPDRGDLYLLAAKQ
jgi:hypothetical protein